ncbi:MAG: type II toxin-antitoxin system RelE/ParE family toxin [Rhodobacter sp.]|nr:type II toxin-antitoxin system RelE/ParE family toxin [Rhodobacter sp.]
MKERQVAFAPEARDDLFAIYDWITERAGPEVALGYVARLEAFCLNLSIGSERGSLRDDVRTGLRVIGFERRVNVAFVVEETRVVVLRLFAGGRNWDSPDHWPGEEA